MLTAQHGVDRGCPSTDEGKDSRTNSSKAPTMQTALSPFDSARLTHLLKGCDPATLNILYQHHNEPHPGQQQLKQTDASKHAVCDTEGDDTTHTSQQAVTSVCKDSDQQQGNSAYHLQQNRQTQQQLPGSTCQSSSAQSDQEPHLITSTPDHLTGREPAENGSTATGKTVAATAVATVLAAVALAGQHDPVKPDLQQQLQQLTPVGSTAAGAVSDGVAVAAVAAAASAAAAAADKPYAKPPLGAVSTAAVNGAQASEQEPGHMLSSSSELAMNQHHQQQFVEAGGGNGQPQLHMLLHTLQQQQQVNAPGGEENALHRRVNAVEQRQEDNNKPQSTQLEHSSGTTAATAAAGGGDVGTVPAREATDAALRAQPGQQHEPDVSAAAALACGDAGAIATPAGGRPAAAAESDSSRGHTSEAAAAAGGAQKQQQQHEQQPKRPLMPWEELEVSANHKKLPEGRTQQQQNVHHPPNAQQLQQQQEFSGTAHDNDEQQQQQQQLLMLQQLAAQVQSHQQLLPNAEELDLDPTDPAYAAALAAPLPLPAAPAGAAAVPSSSDTFVMSLNCDYKVWLPELLQRKRLFEECPNCGDSLIVKYFNISCPTQAHCYNCCPKYSRVVDASALRTASGGQVEAALAIATSATAAAAAGGDAAAAAGGMRSQQQQQLGHMAMLGLVPMQEQPSQPVQRKQKRNKAQKQADLEQHQGPLLLPLYHSALRGSIAAANPHDLLSLHINISGVKAFQRNNGTKPFMLLQSQVWGGNSGQRIPGVLQAAGLGGTDSAALQAQRHSQRRQGKSKDSGGGAAAAAAAAAGGGGVDCIGCRLYRAEAASQQLQQQNPQQQLYCSLGCKWQQAGLASFLLHQDEKPLEWEVIPSKPLAGGGVRLGRKRKMDGIEADAFWKGTVKKGKGGKAAAAAAAGAAASWDPAAAAAAPVGGQPWEPMPQLQQLRARAPKSRKKKVMSVQDLHDRQDEYAMEEDVLGQQFVGLDPLHLLEAAVQLSEQQEQQQQHLQGQEEQEHTEEGGWQQQQPLKHVQASVERGQH